MNKRTVKACGFVLLLFIGIVAALYGSKKLEEAENRRLISEYCTFSIEHSGKCETLDDCIDLLLSLDAEKTKLQKNVESAFPAWREKTATRNKLLFDVIEERSIMLADQIINSFVFSNDYSNEELCATIVSHADLLRRLKHNYDETDYARAFANFLDNSPVYANDCIHYIVQAAYPEVFSVGLREHLLDVGVVAWANDGEVMLSTLLKYIDSMPKGRKEYEADIKIAKRQLEERTAQYLADEKQRMMETTTGYPFYVGMRESEVRSTLLGAPDSVERCLNFDVLVPRARHKTYEWDFGSEHGWYKITIYYRLHKSRRFDDYEDLPADNGYVAEIAWIPAKGKSIRTYSITDTYK